MTISFSNTNGYFGLTPVNVGSTPNDGTGDKLRNAFITTNTNLISIVDFLFTTPILPNLETISDTIIGGNLIVTGNISGHIITNANLTGDITSIGNNTTLATVNSNVGIFGNSSFSPTITVNSKGLITTISVSNISITGNQVSYTDSGTTPLGNTVEAALETLAEAAKVLLGTANQITVDSSVPGNLTLSLPQSIAATSSPTFVVVTADTFHSTATGITPPFTVASSTVVGNLNVTKLEGATWEAPGNIGSTTPALGKFTTISASDVITSTVTTGTAPFTINSVTLVTHLNSQFLNGNTFAIPGQIGAATPNTGSFTFLGAGIASSTSANLVVGGGTSTVVPILMTSGTTLTSAVAGGIEYDGAVFYTTPSTSSRGLMPSEQFVVMGATAKTLTANSAAQSIFGATSNGAVTLPTGMFKYECAFAMTGLSATAGTISFGLGGDATFTFSGDVICWKGTAGVGAAAVMNHVTSANTVISGSSTGTAASVFISGVIFVTGSGTIIPQVAMSQASAANIVGKSYFRVFPTTSAQSGNVTIGNWS